MKLKVLVIALLMIGILGCKNKTTITAKQYSDDVVKMEQSLAEPIRQAENEIKNYADSLKYDQLSAAAKKMEDIIQAKIDTLERVDVAGFNGGDDFKTVAVRYFGYIKSLYTSYKAIGDAKDEPGRIAASDKMNQILSVQQNVNLNMQEAQVKFAAENGFELASPGQSEAPAADSTAAKK